MKRQTQTTGVRTYFGEDLIALQAEPLAAIDTFFAQYGPCVIQGCEVTDNVDGTVDIAAGLVALDVAERGVTVMPFGGAAGVALPLYMTAKVEAVTRPYDDGEVKLVAYNYTAQVSALPPADGSPALVLSGGDGQRFVDVLQDSAHRFITDAERAGWDAKLNKSSYTAADVLAKLLTIDGHGSGLVADMVADQKTGGALKVWKCTETEYNAIGAKSDDTLYVVL